MDRKIVLIILLTLILLITPIAAKEITDTVDDKNIKAQHTDSIYLIHTQHYGDIKVTETYYQKIFIGDNITFDTESSWGIYNILKINGGKINGEI